MAWRALIGAGALQGLAAGTLSMAAARGRRGALAAGGGAAHASLVLALLRWRAARTDLALPALAAAAWGACAALWDVLQVTYVLILRFTRTKLTSKFQILNGSSV